MMIRFHCISQTLNHMETKKSKRANLEKRKGTFLLTGTVITLSLIVISFEWTNEPETTNISRHGTEIQFDITQVELIPRDNPKPKELLPEIKKILVPADEEDVEFGELLIDHNPAIETRYKPWFNFRPDTSVEKIDEIIPFISVQQKPGFNGGDPVSEFGKFIAKHLRYPQFAAANGIEGKVVVKFVVDKTGTVTDLEILRPVHPDLDEEAVRVISLSPKWTPGKQQGRPVSVSFNFPINFVLH